MSHASAQVEGQIERLREERAALVSSLRADSQELHVLAAEARPSDKRFALPMNAFKPRNAA
jgi:hypothetical protein